MFLIAGVLVVMGEWRSLSAQEQPAPSATVIEQTSPTANDVNLSPIDHNADFEVRLNNRVQLDPPLVLRKISSGPAHQLSVEITSVF